MRYRAFVMLGVAVALGSASVYLVRDMLDSRTQTAPAVAPVAISKVVIARRPLGFGAHIRPEHLEMVDWPANAIPPGAFTSVDELIGAKGEERVVLRSIEANEPILQSKISGQGGRATLSTIIGEGMRALTIRVNDVNGVAGFVLPNDRVDVLLTREQSRTEATTDVLLQNVKVLGIDQEAGDRKDQPRVARAVTLEVTSDQAQKLTLGAEVGSLSLALRNHANGDEEKVRTVTLSDLRPPPSARPAPVYSGASVAIMRGTSQSKVNVRKE